MKKRSEVGRRSVVEQASAPLAQAMREEAGKELEQRARRPTDWESNNPAKGSDLDPAFEAIVSRVFVDDPASAYERLEQGLVVGDKRGDYGTMMRHLDEAEGNVRLAHRLWKSAEVERRRWELDNEVVFGAMRSAANKSLQAEKAEGHRSKQITDADVDSRVATMFPDEWRAQEARRHKVKAMVDSMQNLTEVWLSRCRTLQVMMGKQR